MIKPTMEAQQVSIKHIAFGFSYVPAADNNDLFVLSLDRSGGQRSRRRGRRGHEMPNFENIMQEFLISISVSRMGSDT